jgi:hypothetical protein
MGEIATRIDLPSSETKAPGFIRGDIYVSPHLKNSDHRIRTFSFLTLTDSLLANLTNAREASSSTT